MLPVWKNNYQLIKIFRKNIFEIFIYFNLNNIYLFLIFYNQIFFKLYHKLLERYLRKVLTVIV